MQYDVNDKPTVFYGGTFVRINNKNNQFTKENSTTFISNNYP